MLLQLAVTGEMLSNRKFQSTYAPEKIIPSKTPVNSLVKPPGPLTPSFQKK
jgi:hypothetical protein